MVTIVQLIGYDEKRRLAQRVRLGSYYTDGRELCVAESIGATGCVVIRYDDEVRCLDILDFRRWFWLVREQKGGEQ